MYDRRCENDIRAQEIALGFPCGPNVRGSRRLADSRFTLASLGLQEENSAIWYKLYYNLETDEIRRIIPLETKQNPFTGKWIYLIKPEDAEKWSEKKRGVRTL